MTPPATGLIQQDVDGQRTRRPSHSGQCERFVAIRGLGIDRFRRERIRGGRLHAKLDHPLGQALKDARPAVGHELGKIVTQPYRQPLVDIIELHQPGPAEGPIVDAGQRFEHRLDFADQLKDRDGARLL